MLSYLIKNWRNNQPISQERAKFLKLADENNLDKESTYFILDGSFGDKWCILSYLPNFLELYPNVRILASKKDRELIRIFVGDFRGKNTFTYLEPSIIESFSSITHPHSEYTRQIWCNQHQLTQTPSVNQAGFGNSQLRHLHLVKYPYFSDLHLIHGVSYGTLMKMILYLPASEKSRLPKYYFEQDRIDTDELLKLPRNEQFSRTLLFNITNISHLSLSLDQIILSINEFNNANFFVFINLTQHPDETKISEKMRGLDGVATLIIPGHLLALVSESVDAVFGIVGGAMCISVQFSTAHCRSLYTPAVGFSETTSTVYGGQYEDNVWRLIDKDWPCLFPNRVLDNVYIGDPQKVSDSDLIKHIREFIHHIENSKKPPLNYSY